MCHRSPSLLKCGARKRGLGVVRQVGGRSTTTYLPWPFETIISLALIPFFPFQDTELLSLQQPSLMALVCWSPFQHLVKVISEIIWLRTQFSGIRPSYGRDPLKLTTKTVHWVAVLETVTHCSIYSEASRKWTCLEPCSRSYEKLPRTQVMCLRGQFLEYTTWPIQLYSSSVMSDSSNRISR